MQKLEYVMQEDEKGCGLACIAMLTGHSYRAIKYLYEHLLNKDINTEGIYHFEQLVILSYLGFRDSVIEYGTHCSLHPGRAFMLSVPSLNTPGGIHNIIFQAHPEGNIIYDPSNKEKKYTELPSIWFDVMEIVYAES
jgi:hypothetical protein